MSHGAGDHYHGLRSLELLPVHSNHSPCKANKKPPGRIDLAVDV
jgi:hypothetical protein